MINLMPPDLKEQVKFAKMNRLVLSYMRVVVVVVVVLAGIFAGAVYLLRQQSSTVAADVADKQKVIDDLSKTFLPKATDASERLNAIKYVQDTQTKFSKLMADIVAVLPRDVKIDSIAFTGNEKAPVRLTVTAKTYESALALRNSLVTSPRLSAADIESINNGTDGWSASLVLGFKPGQAK